MSTNFSQQDQVQVADDDELKCAICLQQMHSPFGLLEHCPHLFCGEWEKTDPQKRCPVCRVQSRRVLLLSNASPILNEQTKLELFRLQARCIDLFHGGNRGQERPDQERPDQERPDQELEQRVQELVRLGEELEQSAQEREQSEQESQEEEEEEARPKLLRMCDKFFSLFTCCFRSSEVN